ncbi:MAG: PorV/PorQ family protein [bacterium]
MRRSIVSIFILILTTSITWAKDNTGATFLKIGVGPRPTAMGEAFCAVANDVNAIYWNPAGLAQIKGQQLLLIHNQWFEDINHDYIGFAQNITSNRTFGGNITYLRIDNLIGRDEIGNKTDDFNAYDLALGLAYGEKLSKHLLIGVHLKCIYQLNENVSGSGIAADIGWLYKTDIKNLDLGLCIQNIGTKIKFIDTKEILPLNIKLGIAYKVPSIFTIAVDGNIPREGDICVNTGTEITILNFMSMRVGYKSQTDLDSETHWSYGVGFKIRNYHINYAFVPYGLLGDTHRLALLLKFD